MRPVSQAELLLAYRHAKHALFQEQRGMTRLDTANAEDALPQFLTGLARRLATGPGWFTSEDIGEVWVVPKRIEPIRRPEGIATIGEAKEHPTRVHIRMHLAPALSYATVEVLWLWDFGPVLEALLSPRCYGNRLKMVDDRVDRRSRGPFAFWPKQYERFRSETFEAARLRLRSAAKSCMLATFDLASCYDSIDPTFLTDPEFIRGLEVRAAERTLQFDAAEYLAATQTLLARIDTYRATVASITGADVPRGIPIGALTSGLIANLALAPLDDHILNVPGVRHYARYVDDILIVADSHEVVRRTTAAIAATFLPVVSSPSRKRIVLDAARLKRPGCSFTLSASKLKVYFLRGRRGVDFLATVERDVRWIASERRAFLNPDGLGTDSPFAALVAGSDGKTPVQILRDVDRLKVERYAASVQLGKAATGVEMLPPEEARRWARTQVRSLAGVATDTDNWGDFADLSLRALAVCIRATDYFTARQILARHRRRLRSMIRRPSSHPIKWGELTMTAPEIRTRLAAWFQMRHLDCVAASVRFDELSDESRAHALIHRLAPGLTLFTAKPPTVPELRAAAELLARCDLRTADRESDRSDGLVEDHAADRNDDEGWRALLEAMASDPLTETMARDAESFLAVCRELEDRVYSGLSPLSLMLMTRPPSSFDVQVRYSAAGRPPEDGVRVTNAIRGTNYDLNSVRGSSSGLLDVTPPFVLSFGQSDVVILLANMRSELPWFEGAAAGSPELGTARLAGLARIVNQAVDQSNGKRPAILLLPELSVPRRWIRPLVARMLAEGISTVAGLEYQPKNNAVANEVLAVMSTGRYGSGVSMWRKGRPAREEAKALTNAQRTFIPGTSQVPARVKTEAGTFSVLICSEMLEVELRSTLIGRVDFLLVPAWNKDTATFDHSIQTVANDLHCYVAIANNAIYSDSRVYVPKFARHERDVCRLVCRSSNDILATTINVTSLRRFQKNSILDPTFPPDRPDPEFKAIPPRFRNRRS